MKSTNNTLNKKKYGIALARCFGIGILFALLNTAKITIGRLRPHFLAVCMPNVDIRNCLPNTFITEYVCTNPDTKKVKDSRVSFPSNHSAFSFYTAVFIACYYHRRSKVFDKFVVVASLIKIFLLGGAGYCAFSRISDYKHHPEDILVGSFLGIIGGYYFESRTFYDEEDICEHTILNTQRSNKVTDA
uniref:AcidPPc domain-containing protein n=1 Tax=Rhabditophanes sp. KR3021 TaxID=114890 RepID=A0AC35TJB0_9BILA